MSNANPLKILENIREKHLGVDKNNDKNKIRTSQEIEKQKAFDTVGKYVNNSNNNDKI